MKIVERKISELIPAEYNPRQLTDKQFKDLKKSLQKFGFVDPVIVNTHKERKNIIIGGHQRCKVWEELGNDTVPTVELCLTFKQEQELNTRLNRNTGEWDFDKLANLFETDDLLDWGFEKWELDYDPKEEKEESEGGTSSKDESSEELAVVVLCADSDEQQAVMQRIASIGLLCFAGTAKRDKKAKNKDEEDDTEDGPKVGFKASMSR